VNKSKDKERNKVRNISSHTARKRDEGRLTSRKNGSFREQVQNLKKLFTKNDKNNSLKKQIFTMTC
jgi:hypothetical protein